MKTALRKTGYRQHGAVLVVSLIMLVVMTLFVISMLKTSIVELKIGGSSQVAALNFSNAEVAIDNFIAANNGLFAPRFLTTTVVNTAPIVYGGAVAVTPVQLNCGPWANFGSQMGGTALQAVQFNIRAVATGALGGSVTLNQGVQTLAPPNSC